MFPSANINDGRRNTETGSLVSPRKCRSANTRIGPHQAGLLGALLLPPIIDIGAGRSLEFWSLHLSHKKSCVKPPSQLVAKPVLGPQSLISMLVPLRQGLREESTRTLQKDLLLQVPRTSGGAGRDGNREPGVGGDHRWPCQQEVDGSVEWETENVVWSELRKGLKLRAGGTQGSVQLGGTCLARGGLEEGGWCAQGGEGRAGSRLGAGPGGPPQERGCGGDGALGVE